MSQQIPCYYFKTLHHVVMYVVPSHTYCSCLLHGYSFTVCLAIPTLHRMAGHPHPTTPKEVVKGVFANTVLQTIGCTSLNSYTGNGCVEGRLQTAQAMITDQFWSLELRVSLQWTMDVLAHPPAPTQ